VEDELPEIEMVGITNKKGMIRKTVHSYPKTGLVGTFGQVRDFIVLESSWLGSYEPYVTKTVDCYITQLMIASQQQQLMGQYQLASFEVRALSAERTICEKIMSLVRFSQTNTPIDDPRNKIRHIYDLHIMLSTPELGVFLQSTDFDALLLRVGNDDINSFKNNNGWLANHPKDAILFTEVQKTWNQLKTTYQNSFKHLVTGDLPEETRLVETLKLISNRLQSIIWTINPKQEQETENYRQAIVKI